jgi:poly(3-hydroxybutyrate) depolymerase
VSPAIDIFGLQAAKFFPPTGRQKKSVVVNAASRGGSLALPALLGPTHENLFFDFHGGRGRGRFRP